MAAVFGKEDKPKPKPAKKNTVADAIKNGVGAKNTTYTGGNAQILAQLLAASQQSSAEIFGPQFRALDQQRNATTDRYNGASQQTRAWYDALARRISGQKAGTVRDYTQTGRSMDSAYDQAAGAVDRTFDKSQNDMTAMLKRLGIQQAGPEVLDDATQARTMIEGLLQNTAQTAQNTNATLGQNVVDYDRHTSNATRAMGQETSSAFQRQLQEALSGNDSQRLQLQGQQSQYDASARTQALQDAMQAATAQQSAEAKQRQTDFENEMLQARLELDKGKFGLDVSKAGQTQPSKDPYAILAQRARELYGNDRGAGNAINAVMDTLTRGGGNFPTLQSFLELLNQRNPQAMVTQSNPGGDIRKLQQLATLLYGSLPKNVMSGFGQ